MWPNTLDGVVWDIQMSDKARLVMMILYVTSMYEICVCPFLAFRKWENLVNYAFRSLENGEIGVLRCF